PPPAEPQYRPSAALTRLIHWRDRRCLGPGCSVPANRCDLEHRTPWPHGPTSADNLNPISRHCHHAKQAGWTYTRQPDGSTTWHPPRSRRTYTVPADP
ncbi:MAG TPA: HNH endonuclease signature motif containing protein, partial [Mycobacteriales bacterium]|nr:HNH endonuclease signature motif containing protein [Mycobacteriales bacterium]